ncbi:P1 family peptidase [Halobacillus sp. B29]|uniref:P1 family peptidase n=1 Tax=Halobacillus sp. B29 TaxID=3457432 RepID=UPI003FCC36B7
MKKIELTDIEGFRIGQAKDSHAKTGCTVMICEKGAKGGVDVRGGSPGTRETDLLRSENLVEEVHAVFLSGGSAYGLDVGTGVMQYLEEHNIGFDVQVARVPIVPGAILFDLHTGEAGIRPDLKMGYQACTNAFSHIPFKEGTEGAGAGATVGKVLGPDHAMKGGIGSYAVQAGNLKIGAVVAVNSFGDVIDPETGQIVAGVQKEGRFLGTENVLIQSIEKTDTNRFSGNTTIGSVITNAKLTKPQANKIAALAHDGLARTIRPSHTFVDGDTLFTLTTNEVEVDLNGLSSLAAYVVEQAVLRAIQGAQAINDS